VYVCVYAMVHLMYIKRPAHDMADLHSVATEERVMCA